MTIIVIEIEVPVDVEHAFATGTRAMVAPVTEAEAEALGTDIVLVHEGLEALADSLVAYVDGREAQGLVDPELRSALVDIAGHLSRCAAMQDRVREAYGRAVFVNVFPKARTESTENAGAASRRKSAEVNADGLMRHLGKPTGRLQ